MAVEAAEIALAAAVDQHRRQPVGEGLAGQAAIPHAGDQPVGRNGEAVFRDRLAEQRMQKISGAGAQAVAPEQLGVDELTQLPGLGRGQVLDVLEPGMPPPRRRTGPGRPHSQGAAKHGPGGMARPAPDCGEEGRRKGHKAFPAVAVCSHRRIRSLEEDRVPALPRDERRGAAAPHAGGDFCVIGDVQALERRPYAFAERTKLAQGDGLDWLADSQEVEFQARRDRRGIGAFVALAPVAVEVEKARPPGPAGRGHAGGHAGGDDSAVQTAGKLRHDPAMRLDQLPDGGVHHSGQTAPAFVPSLPGAAEGRRSPHWDRRLHLGDQGDHARIDRRQTLERKAVAQQFGRLGDLAKDGPVDGDICRHQGVQRPGRLLDRQYSPAETPPDAVDRAGGIAKHGEAAVIGAPGQDVSTPAGGRYGPSQVRRTLIHRDNRRQRRRRPAPFSDQKVATPDLPDLEPRARAEQDLDILDGSRGAPTRAHQVGEGRVDRRTPGLAKLQPIDDQIAVRGRTGRRHRQYRGV